MEDGDPLDETPAEELGIRLDFFFNETAATEIYTLSLHDALPILAGEAKVIIVGEGDILATLDLGGIARDRSEEHTSELQSRVDLVCRLLLEKKKRSRPTCPTTTRSSGSRKRVAGQCGERSRPSPS